MPTESASSDHDAFPPLALGVSEAAHAIGLSVPHFRHLIYRGEIRARKVGRRVLVPVAELHQFLERNPVVAGKR